MEIVASSHPIIVWKTSTHSQSYFWRWVSVFCLSPYSFGATTHHISSFYPNNEISYLETTVCLRYWTFMLNSKMPKSFLEIGFSTASSENLIRAMLSKQHLFLLPSLCCLGHPRWRMFKIRLDNSGLYMLHEHIRKSENRKFIRSRLLTYSLHSRKIFEFIFYRAPLPDCLRFILQYLIREVRERHQNQRS